MIRHARPLVGRLLLVLHDLVGIAAVVAVTLAIRRWLPGGEDLRVQAHAELWPLLAVFSGIFAALGLYRVVAIGPAEELRRLFQGLSLGFIAAAAISFMAKMGDTYSRMVFLLAWGGCLVALPVSRTQVRSALARCGLWGYPVVILGGGMTGRLLIRALHRNPTLGLRPVALFDDALAPGSQVEGVTVRGPLESIGAAADLAGVQHAIVAMPGAPAGRLRDLERANRSAFPHLLIIPNLCGFVAAGVMGRDLGGILGLEMRRNLLLTGPRFIKRSSDLLLSALLVLPIGLLVLLLALAIKLDSPGPVFFGHGRIGRGGRTFKAWKFRSMVSNSQEVLQKLLAESAEARAEWEADHKLRNDPRVTRVGRFLRLTSLDELPQAWNVLIGDMSFIGPRPIVSAEIPKYGEVFDLYQQVRPGISGLWQVSGRNDTTYEERVALDDYYVRNWSVWLDLHILIRTVKVVLFGKGAY